jgi:hypothetical protein
MRPKKVLCGKINNFGTSRSIALFGFTFVSFFKAHEVVSLRERFLK